MFLLLSEEKKEPKKSLIGCSPAERILVQGFSGAISGKLPYILAPLDSPRASGVCVALCLWLTLTIICIRFGIRADGGYLFRAGCARVMFATPRRLRLQTRR